MKTVLIIAGVIILGMVGWFMRSEWNSIQAQEKAEAEARRHPPEPVVAAGPMVGGTDLSGMKPNLEPALQQAQARGAVGLKNFLARYGKAIQDPRRASIELDYVVLEARDNLAEARRVFAEVKNRVDPASPVYPRVQQLARTYE
jgi:Flp pilus assembly protein CpaB